MNGIEKNRPVRVLLTSDVHHGYTKTWYGVPSEERMQRWVDAIKEEHENSPIDLIIFAGDASLDHYIDRGSYTNDGISTSEQFVKDYVSQLPPEIPIFIGAGNHEKFNDEQWESYTGNKRNGAVALRDDLFIIVDSFSSGLEPNYDGKTELYSPVDVGFIKEQMEKHPDKRVWIVSHWIEKTRESEEFKSLVREDPRIIGLFAGHIHRGDYAMLGEEFGNKVLAYTGQFSYSFFTAYPHLGDMDALYNSFWGFRELLIYPDMAQSSYIRVKTQIPTYRDIPYDLERNLIYGIEYLY